MKLTFTLIILTALLSGCSTFNRVFPDRTNDYREAESLPDLEIPPDLTAGAINANMSVPGEQRNRESGSQAGGDTVAMAEIESINNKPLLSIPDEFTLAWTEVEGILQNAGVIINKSDQTTGMFEVNYYPDAPQEDEGFLSRLAFWKRGGSKPYKLSLTGVGNKTELVVLNMNDEWIADTESDLLLATIRDHYNLAKTQ